jgi:hypothetical protein
MLRCRSGAETAGRPTTRAALKDISGATYIERQAIDLMADLAPDEALDARQHPIVGNDRVHDVAIFPIMLAVGGGYPYALQLVGQRTWDAADGHEMITVEHARGDQRQCAQNSTPCTKTAGPNSPTANANTSSQ